jgi:ABC-type transport system involved in multi-copper enzyme maturation permease subunit
VIGALVWKEYREHRSVWIAMALLAVVSLTVAVPLLLPHGWKAASDDNAFSLLAATFIVTGMYGLVCGAMMFAGERESHGMGFLDTLPLGRGTLWWWKVLIGAVFVLLYSGVVLTTGIAMGLVGPGAIHPAATVLLPFAALECYVLGLCASTFCRTVLTAVALAALVPVPVLWFCSGLVVVAVASNEGGALGLAPVALFFHGLILLVALGVSLFSFFERDFEKRFALKPTTASYGAVAPKRQPLRSEVMLWLALRQGGVLAGVMVVVGFLLGFGLPTAGFGLWPALTVLLGVGCGTAVFAGEQAEGAFKFWGDQRLPVGWLWLRRTLYWAVVGAAVAGVMLLAALLHVIAQGHGVPAGAAPALESMLGLPPGVFGLEGIIAFVLLWPTYGFALGQICALVWRKSAVAVVVAIMAAGGIGVVWLPSLLAGGLHVVQVLGVPLLLLLACRLTLWDWITDCLRTRAALTRLVGGTVLAGAWIVGNLAYRVIEAPGGDEPFDRASLSGRIANPEEGRVGRDIRAAVQVIAERERPPDKGGRAVAAPPTWHREELARVIDQGWAGVTPAFQRWITEVAADPVPATLARGTSEPPGILISPTDEAAGPRDAAEFHRVGDILIARALQLQIEGAPDVALDQLLTALGLSRHLRHDAPAFAYLEGTALERDALAGFDHWLTRLGRRPELLRRALERLRLHEEATPPVLVALAGEYLRYRTGLGVATHPKGALSNNTEGQLMQVPWEAERARRLTDAVFAGRRRMAESGRIVPLSDEDPLIDWIADSGGPTRGRLAKLVGTSWIGASLPDTAPAQRAAQLGLCRVRAARLQVALSLYQAEHHGRPATSLADLVPALLPELPEDPFAHAPFGFRVSKGEQIAWPRQTAGGGQEFVRMVAAGQGVLWSVGPDGSDDGGTRQWNEPRGGQGQDVIFLVPRGN